MEWWSAGVLSGIRSYGCKTVGDLRQLFFVDDEGFFDVDGFAFAQGANHVFRVISVTGGDDDCVALVQDLVGIALEGLKAETLSRLRGGYARAGAEGTEAQERVVPYGRQQVSRGIIPGAN